MKLVECSTADRYKTRNVAPINSVNAPPIPATIAGVIKSGFCKVRKIAVVKNIKPIIITITLMLKIQFICFRFADKYASNFAVAKSHAGFALSGCCSTRSRAASISFLETPIMSVTSFSDVKTVIITPRTTNDNNGSKPGDCINQNMVSITTIANTTKIIKKVFERPRNSSDILFIIYRLLVTKSI